MDLAAATILTVAYLFISRWADVPLIPSEVTADRRKDIYITTAAISALVGGFGTAAVAQYASAQGARMEAMRRHFGQSLRKNWSSILTGSLTVAGCCLFLLFADNQASPGSATVLIHWALAFGALRALRLIWLFNMLLHVSDSDALRPQRSPAIQFDLSSERDREVD